MNPMYKIEKIKRLGSGTYGSVYECYYTPDRQRYKPEICAVKYIKSDQCGIKCVNELLIMSMFDHQNIMSAKQIYYENDGVAIVMSKAERSLFDFKSDLLTIRKVVIDILNALKVLHSAGFIHGDLKPDNILKFGNVFKLTDFSISTTNITKNKSNICTINYRPPEAFSSNKSWNEKVDIWALGCTVFELVFGMLLFPTQERLVEGSEYGIAPKMLNAIHDWARDTGQECAIVHQNDIQYIPYQYSRRFFEEESYNKVADFIIRCCQIDPNARWSAHDLLTHPFINIIPREIQYSILQYADITYLKSEALEMITNYCVEYKLSDFFIEYLTKSVMIAMAITRKFETQNVVNVMMLLMCKIFGLKIINNFVENKLTTHDIKQEILLLMRLKYIMPLPRK